MTSITGTKFLDLKKNKTGLFAANTIHEIKPSRNFLITGPTLSPRFRHNSLASLLFASSEQKQHKIQQYLSSKHEIEQYYPLKQDNNSNSNSRLTLNSRRNGFPPSMVRHQKVRVLTANSHRNITSHENKDPPSKPINIPPRASAKLKSEIDYLQNQLSKTSRLQDSREFESTSHGTLSYSTSCRLPSASTIFTVDRIHKRFSSAATHCTTNMHMPIPIINDVSTQTTPILSNIVTTTVSPITETDNNNQQEKVDHRLTHAYQIPQQSNVGNESVFVTDSSHKTRSIKTDLKSVACPFYVMYFTNLTMQQAQTKDEQEIPRKIPVNSRISTIVLRRQSTKRQVNSQLSINTDLTSEDNVYTVNSTPFSRNRYLSTKIPANENGNSSKLQDILRTSSCNHVKV